MDDASRPTEEMAGAGAGAAAGRASAGRPHSHRVHGSRSRRPGPLVERLHARHRRQRLVRRVLAGSVVVLGLAVALLLRLLLRTTTDLRTTRDRLVGDVQAAQQQAAERDGVAKRLQAELAEAVQGRLPRPLQPLVPDQIIALEQSPLRSILFTYVGTTDRPGYEYRLVCRNDGSDRFLSAVRILLFSETGIQIGAAEVSDSADWTRLGAAGLAPGESAAFSGRVALQFGDQPRYFLVLTLAAEGRLPRLSP